MHIHAYLSFLLLVRKSQVDAKGRINISLQLLLDGELVGILLDRGDVGRVEADQILSVGGDALRCHGFGENDGFASHFGLCSSVYIYMS